MISREQLKLAARAAGIVVVYEDGTNLWIDYNRVGLQVWNPQHDHGQLHDLAMACKIRFDPNNNEIEWEMLGGVQGQRVDCQDFPALAEAVIQAAAEQQMAKEGQA